MKKTLIISLLCLIFNNNLKAQSNELFEIKKEGINTEIEKIDSEILTLKKNRELLKSKLTELNEEKIKKEFENKKAEGFELKTSVMDVTLRDSPSWKGNDIIKVPGNSTITIYDIDFEKSIYFKAKYKDKFGYIIKTALVLTDELKLLEKKSIKIDSKMERLIRMYGGIDANRIARKQYWIGMTKEMAIESIGKPSDSNKSTGSWGVHEQWIYNNRELYLYFENGNLASFQD